MHSILIWVYKYVFSAGRSHVGITLVPNLFGKPTILAVGGGELDSDLDEVVKAFPYVESHQVIILH